MTYDPGFNEKGEPFPAHPQRLEMKDVYAWKDPEDGQIYVQATFAYDAWCCSEQHEIVDAARAVGNAVGPIDA